MPFLQVSTYHAKPVDNMDIVEVVNGNLTLEATDAIVSIIGADMDMNNFGQLSKAIAQASGPQVQQECSQKGTGSLQVQL